MQRGINQASDLASPMALTRIGTNDVEAVVAEHVGSAAGAETGDRPHRAVS